MLDKKKIQVIFLFKFKMGRKAVKTTCNINNAFSPGTADEHILQWWVRFSSVQFSRSVVSDSLRSHESQHARPPCPSPTPGVHSDSRPSNQWWRSFTKETRALKMRSTVVSHGKFTITNLLRAIIKANPLTTTWEVAEELQHWPLYGHCAFETNWKGKKAWQVGASWADQESKKSSFWSVVFTYSTQQQQTISLLDCDMW